MYDDESGVDSKLFKPLNIVGVVEKGKRNKALVMRKSTTNNVEEI